jgi:hypothetical protein
LGWDQIKDETLWCTQKAMAQLFGVGIPAISKHLNHIWERELTKDVVVSKMEIVTQHADHNKRHISKAQADAKAESEYDIFNKTQ